MIEHDQKNEEYKLDDLDLLASEPSENLESLERSETSEDEHTKAHVRHEIEAPFVEQWLSGLCQLKENPVFKKGFFVVLSVFLLMLLYRMLPHHDNKTSTMNVQSMATSIPKPAPQATQAPMVPVEHQSAISTQKIDEMVASQHQMYATLESTTAQMTAMTASIADLSHQMTQLSMSLATLNQKIDAQVQALDALKQMKVSRAPVFRGARPQRRVTTSILHHPNQPIYFLQAVIPGRAWIVNQDGINLTVRVGTAIAGYGTVRKIDADQGIVLTSSGRTIRFNQVDS